MATLLHPHEAPAAMPAAELEPTSDRARLALATGGAALLLGVAGDLLVRGFQPGAGWAVTLSLLVVALGMLAARRGGLSPEQRLLLFPIVFLAESFAWRDAEALHVINLLALLVSLAALSMSLASAGTWSIATAGFVGLVRACLHAAGSAIGGAVPLLFADMDFRGATDSVRARRLGAIGRGALVTLPVMLVFGGLLASADPVFGRLIGDLVDLDLGDAVAHVVAIGAFCWLAAGYLRGSLLGEPLVRGGTRLGLSAGIVEVGMVLGAVNVLFLSFLLLQARYLFGGAEHVLATAGLTYAQYARSGFFELMFVAVLAIPLLMVSHALLRKDEGAALRTYRRLAAVLALQVGVLLVSAGARMRLYVHEYGLTEDRIYASAVMIWLATVFAAFYLTVLRGRPHRLGGAALVTGWMTLGALNVANPDVLTARVNLARAADGRPLDGYHLGRLGADAVPLAIEALPRLTPTERCSLSRSLLHRWSTTPSKGWRDWNKGRASARDLVAAQRATLEGHTANVGRVGGCGTRDDVAYATVTSSATPMGRETAVRAWWDTPDPARRGVRVESPAAAEPVRPSVELDQTDALAIVDAWFAATSFPLGHGPDWPRLQSILAPAATLVPPRAEVPLAGEPPHGMWRTAIERSVQLTGDHAQAVARYELRHDSAGPVVARGTAMMQLRRIAGREWRLTSVAWDQPATPASALRAP